METLYPSLSHMSNLDWYAIEAKGPDWTKEENKRFESALAVYGEETPDRWLKIADWIPGKTVYDVMRQYKKLEEDVLDIEAGLVPDPAYIASQPHHPIKFSEGKGAEHERKKGVPWTQQEHRRFLLGILKYGKGDWRNISRKFVVSKTPTQVASHAQKYYQRQSSGMKDKKRPSIHDVTVGNLLNNLDQKDDNRNSNDEPESMLFGQVDFHDASLQGRCQNTFEFY